MRKFKRSLSLRERVRVRESRRLATGGLLLSLAFSLAGCWKVGPDYVKPQVDTPKQWRFADKAARDTTNLKWWKLLGDPMLDKLVNRAILGNLDLKIAVARVDEFMGLYGTTRSNLFPQVSGFAEYHRQVLPVLGERNVTRLGGQLSWELDVWGALRRANEAAFADLLGQEAFQRAVILTLASDVAQTYIQLRTLDKNLEITRRMVGTLEEQLSIETIRFKEGFGSELEVSQVQSEYERRQALIPVAEQAIAQTEHALKVLLGQNPGPIPRGKSLDELKLPAVPAGLPSDLLVRRPDIRIAEQTLIAANARIGVARGLYFPKVLITGDLGQLASQTGELFTPGRNFWSIGSNILGPIFTAGKIAGQVQATEAVQRQAVANYQVRKAVLRLMWGRMPWSPPKRPRSSAASRRNGWPPWRITTAFPNSATMRAWWITSPCWIPCASSTKPRSTCSRPIAPPTPPPSSSTGPWAAAGSWRRRKTRSCRSRGRLRYFRNVFADS